MKTPSTSNPGAIEQLEFLIERLFVDTPSAAAILLLRRALERSIVNVDDLARVFDHLRRCRALPRRLDLGFTRHFIMWLEIINHALFIPIITAPRRLDALASLLAARLPETIDRGQLTIVDVGTGQPPYTTIELASRFAPAIVHGFDLYQAHALIRRPDGAYAVFDSCGSLRGCHSEIPVQLHEMILNWSATRSTFEERLAVLEIKARDGVANDKGWTFVEHPGRALIEAAGRPAVHFHCVEIGNFQLTPLEDASVDVVWSFNCLLHYPLVRRAALASLARCCRIGGLVMEGYTSPTGGHAVYQLWRREKVKLVPVEFGWTLSNLRRPLWPLVGHDPQIDLLAEILSEVKNDPVIAAYSRSATTYFDQRFIERLIAYLNAHGRPTTIFNRHFIVHDTNKGDGALGLESPIVVG